jgi:hypothetical protein
MLRAEVGHTEEQSEEQVVLAAQDGAPVISDHAHEHLVCDTQSGVDLSVSDCSHCI